MWLPQIPSWSLAIILVHFSPCTHTRRGLCKPEPVQLAIDEGKLAGVLLYLYGLRRVHWEHAIRHVALVWRYPCIWLVDSANLHRFYLFRWARSDPRRPQSFLR